MNSTVKATITKTLLDMGINPRLLGYTYLKRAIELTYTDRTYLRRMTSRLYPDLAQEFNATPFRVERAIRHCISRLYETSDPEHLEKIMGNITNINTGKVTNSTFIATVAERISLELGG